MSTDPSPTTGPVRAPLRVPRVDLGTMLRDAAAGRFPAPDGGFSRAAPWKDGVEGAVAFTGHAVMVVGDDVSDGQLAGLGVHGFGGAHEPRTTLALAGAGPVGVLDALLVGHGTGAGGPLVARADLAETDRAAHAGEWRTEVDVYGLPDPGVTSLATLSRGIGGLPEVGIQAEDGYAATLLEGVLGRLPRGEVVLASVTPGNARSLRFFLRRGFVPVASEQLWKPRREHGADLGR
ncbi:N-acetyltransferase [Serinicoccus chungangensis]|uniref:N-acetyltransferase n=1 Tax=Serinicoccus chungangensis TaxID=767452 RepID=UPI00111ACC6F|nr:N-acetyltransferase [Serinicoccus chungangensis]